MVNLRGNKLSLFFPLKLFQPIPNINSAYSQQDFNMNPTLSQDIPNIKPSYSLVFPNTICTYSQPNSGLFRVALRVGGQIVFQHALLKPQGCKLFGLFYLLYPPAKSQVRVQKTHK